MKIPSLHGYNPDVHRHKLEQHFGASAGWRVSPGLRDALDALRCFYVVAFTNRCGSNHVAQCLASSKVLLQAGENLNFDTAIRQSAKHGLESYAGYLERIVRQRTSEAGVFGVKASVGQFIGLHEMGVLHAVRDKLRVVHVCREDVVGQAVSMFIAQRTQKWTSTQAGRRADLAYDGDEIFRIVDTVTRENELFRVLFRLLGVEPVTVSYEEFVDKPRRGTRRIGEALGIEDLKLHKAALTYEKQADDLNRQMKERFLSEASLGSR